MIAYVNAMSFLKKDWQPSIGLTKNNLASLVVIKNMKDTEYFYAFRMKEEGNYLKQCQPVIEVFSTIIQVEDKFDDSSLTEPIEDEET